MVEDNNPTELAGDFPCRRCHYNLRGLNPEGRCPECGLPIERSLRRNLLKFSNPIWVRQLWIGARFVGIAWIGVFTIPFQGCLLAGVGAIISRPTTTIMQILYALEFALFLMLFSLGGIQMAHRMPDSTQRRLDRKRLHFLCLSVLSTLVVSVQILQLTLGIGVNLPRTIDEIVLGLQWLLLAYIEFLRAEIVVELCEHIPDNDLAAQARTRGLTLWIPLVALGVFTLIENAIYLTGVPRFTHGARNPVAFLFVFINLISGLVAYVSALLTGIFMLGLANHLRIQAEQAAANWTEPDDAVAPTEGASV